MLLESKLTSIDALQNIDIILAKFQKPKTCFVYNRTLKLQAQNLVLVC